RHCAGAHHDLPSFPTRRSSDLLVERRKEQGAGTEFRRFRRRAGGRAEFISYASLVRQKEVWFYHLYPRPSGKAAPCARMLYVMRSEEHTSELQSRFDLVCRLLL